MYYPPLIKLYNASSQGQYFALREYCLFYLFSIVMDIYIVSLEMCSQGFAKYNTYIVSDESKHIALSYFIFSKWKCKQNADRHLGR